MKRSPLSVFLVTLLTAACADATMDPAAESADDAALKRISRVPVDQSPLYADFTQVDERLREMGLDVALARLEYVTAGASGQAGRILYTEKDRGNRQLIFDWVPGDPRRTGTNAITYVVDLSEGAANAGLSAAQTDAAIDRAMMTWDSQACSTIGIPEVADDGSPLGVIQFVLGYGDEPQTILADVTHAGWLPGGFFNSPPFFPPGGSEFILGVTFTFGLMDGSDFTDVNGDGKIDTAFTETYYNNEFVWVTDDMPFLSGVVYDVETVALHETGHSLSQAHFGEIFVDGGLRFIHFSPFALMNAAISRETRELTGTDRAGHCSIWGNWPNN